MTFGVNLSVYEGYQECKSPYMTMAHKYHGMDLVVDNPNDKMEWISSRLKQIINDSSGSNAEEQLNKMIINIKSLNNVVDLFRE